MFKILINLRLPILSESFPIVSVACVVPNVIMNIGIVSLDRVHWKKYTLQS